MKAIVKNKWIWVIGGIVLIGGLVAFRQASHNGVASGTESSGDTAVVFVGDLAESATASGQVVAARAAGLSLIISGEVVQVDVAAGDTVNAGDVLVRLDTAALERDVASAEQDVAIAKAELADLLAGPSAVDVAAASATARNAQAQLADALAGPDAIEIAASDAAVRATEADMWSASADLDATYDVSQADTMAAEVDLADALEQQHAAHNIWVLLADCEVSDSGSHTCIPVDSDRMKTATLNVQAANAQVAIAQAQLDELRDPDANSIASAQASLAAAVAQHDAATARHDAVLRGGSDADFAAAEADLASTKASLAGLLAGPSETDIAIYEIRVAQAQTGLQEARIALAGATLVAPFDGVITAVHFSEGEQASGLAAEMVDTDSLEVVLDVDEVDLGRLALGQPAVVTLETWPDVEIEAAIAAIAPSATDSDSGLVSYEVHLSLEETSLPVLIGMTANAGLVTARRESVLLVPNAAITADRQAETYTVNLVGAGADGARTTTPVPVTIGLKDGEVTQITSGLSEGDRVLLGELSAPTQQGGFGPGQGHGQGRLDS